MKNQRLLAALLVALLISGACTLLLGRKIGSKRGAAPPQQHYVAAARPIAPGEVIKPDALQEIAWPAAEPLQGGFLKTTDVVGRAAIYPIAAGQPIIDKDLAAAGAGVGITTRIPDGMRAIALRSDDVVGVGGFVFPNSRVDVLVTYRAPGMTEPITATVLQDVEVLATDHQTQPDPEGRPTTVNVATLLLTPQNAERVVLAASQGSLHFILRNGADQQQVNDPPAQLSQFTTVTGQMTASVRHTAARPAAARPRAYVVETILGDKTEQSSF
jgi:pilus assembly protein CpaB